MIKGDQLEVVLRLAKRAGQKIMEIYETDFEVEYKEDESPLTIADKTANDVICEGLIQHFPDIPILSEENKEAPFEERKSWEYFWLVDPLDGTKEFVKKNDEFTVNIALIHYRQPIIGVIYVPVTGELYYARTGEGCFKRDKDGSEHQLQIIPYPGQGPLKLLPVVLISIRTRKISSQTWKRNMAKYIYFPPEAL